MKNTKLLIFTSFFLLSGYQLIAQYEVQTTNPPFSGAFNSVFFTDSNHGWAAGDSGAIYKYNGSSWTMDSSCTNRKIGSLYFSDSLHGWAVGDSGLILYYLNHNWVTIPPVVNFNLDRLSFSDANHGWAVGSEGLIVYSVDSGWRQISTPDLAFFSCVFLVDSTLGYLSGFGGLERHTSTGWSNVSYCFLSTWDVIRRIFFKQNNTGWIIVDWNSLAHSGTKIESWDGTFWHIESYVPQNSIYSIAFYNDRGWFVGGWGTIVCHNNNSWIPQNSGTTSSLYGVSFINENEGWIVGSNGLILHTTTGGFTGINAITAKQSVTCYPNPTAGEVNLVINSQKDEDAILQIWDITSRLIQSYPMKLHIGNNDKIFNISYLDKGTYLMNIIRPSGNFLQKIIKI
ncbi:MAG: YCF48-related protein [Bacteroidetes bacterium]|nr:YCF48-related protein [Bacteroidota bacterium]